MAIRPLFPNSRLFRLRRPDPAARCAWCEAAYTTDYPVVELTAPAEAAPTYHDRCAAAAIPLHLAFETPAAPRESGRRASRGALAALRRLLTGR
jgi:hypothetical protein